MSRRSLSRVVRASLLSVLVVASACGANASVGDLQGVVVDPPNEKPSFQLTDTEGELYDFATETEGKLTLLYFGYLNCPDICPVHLAQIAETFDRLPSVARDAEVVFVSVDPARDTPEAIRAYLDNFDQRFIGLTGTPEELAAAETAVGVPPAVVTGEGEDYGISHAALVIAYAPDGLNYSFYPFGIRQSQWTNDLQVLAAMG